MKHFYAFLLLVLIGNFGVAQVINDDFEDGDLSGWGQGSAFSWTNSNNSTINGTGSLKHNLSNTVGSSYIGYNTSALDLSNEDTSWQFNLKNGSWDPSTGNKFWVYLTANEFNINSNTVDGYAVGVNLTGSSDILTLWKVTNGAADGVIVTSSFNWDSSDTVGIKVTRSAAGDWELLIDTDGDFDNLVSQGTSTNTDYTFNNFFGLSFTFSSSRAGLLRMDDVLVDGIAACTAPALQASSFTTLSPTTTDVNIEFTRGDGDQVLVLMKEGFAVDTDPSNGTSYTANSIFGDPTADELGTGNFVVYNGNEGSNPGVGGGLIDFAVTGLNEGTTYHLAVYEFNTNDTCYNLTKLTGSFTTDIACPAISNLTIDSFTDSEVIVSWTDGDTEADWEIVVQDNGLAAPTSGTATSTNPHTWSGLSATTAYDVYVRADCDTDGFSTWVGPVTFTTPCAIYTPDYTQDFSSIIPECWDEADSGDQASGPSSLGSSSWTEDGYLNSGSTGAYRINLYDVGVSDWLLSPQFYLTGGPFQVGFDIGILEWDTTDTAGTLGSDDMVQLLISNDNGSTWTALVTFDSSSAVPATGSAVSYDLSAYSGQTVQFGIYATEGATNNSEDNNIFIDNFNVVEAKDSDTEVYATTPQILGNTITAADATTVGTAFKVLGFEVQDQGSGDALPTEITTMRFVPGANNTADWTDAIQGITLLDANLVTHTPTVTITDTEIELVFGTPISVADNTALEFSLGIYLNTTNIVDDSVIQLQIDESGSLDANASGSSFVDPYLFGDVIGNDFTIDVDATELVYMVQPSEVFVNSVMSPNVEIAYVDANGNIDTFYSGTGADISLTTDGSFNASATITAEATNGIAVFDNLLFDALGSSLTLTASDDSTFISGTYNSETFDVIAIPVGPINIAFQSFGTDGGDWLYTTDPSTYDIGNDVWDVVDSSFHNFTTIASEGTQFFGVQDLANSNGTSTGDYGEIAFTNVNVSSYTDINISFDYEVDGYDNGDDVEYEVFEDNVSTGRVVLVNGFSNLNQDGTVLISVTEGTTEVSLKVYVSQNGDDYTGFDNFKLEGTIPFTTYTYDGTAWSPSNPDGVSLANEAIVIESGNPSLTSNTDINTVLVNPGASLTIDAGVTLTLTTDLTLESSATSYSSLISDGTIAGTVIYNRHVNTFNNTTGSTNGQNDLISAPVTNASQDFGAFRATNTNIPSGTVSGETTTFYLFGPYDNDAASNPYTLYSDADDATAITAGTGYRTASTDTSTFTFIGDVLTGTVPVTIAEGTDNGWNLIGNPYPSYINSSDFLNANSASLDSEFIGIYGYDGDASNGWTVINLANPTDITPGQGFMVLTDQASTTVNFTPVMRRNTGGNDFIVERSSDTNAYLSLKITNAASQYKTDFYFNNNATRGLDPGYDAGLFNGHLQDFYLYSHLVEENNGVKMTLQSLPENDLTDVVVPLGVNANQLEQITFSIEESTLPSTVEVYLEDNVTNTFTLLNSGDYTITPSTDLVGTGRFYLRYTTTALSASETTLDKLSIYTNTSDKTIVVSGQLFQDTKANLYDIQGRLVTTSLLESSNRSQTVDVSNLSIGVYVIELINETQSKTQKVILR